MIKVSSMPSIGKGTAVICKLWANHVVLFSGPAPDRIG